jgi:hypothetical protein
MTMMESGLGDFTALAFATCEELPPERRLLDAWRQGLKDADFLVKAAPGAERAFFENDDVAGGVVATVGRQMLQKSGRASGGAGDDPDGDTIDVAVAACVLRGEVVHQTQEAGDKEFALLWVPATMARDGRLTRRGREWPWIDRGALRPVGGAPAITVGDLSVADEFRNRCHAQPVGPEWTAWLEFADGYFNAVSGVRPGQFRVDGFVAGRPWIQLAPRRGTSVRLIAAYRCLLGGGGPPIPGALRRLLASPFARPPVAGRPKPGWNGGVTGLMTPRPLNSGQRCAVEASVGSGDGSLVAVTGPPGTGKTSLIAGIVGSVVVEAAIARQSAPLVICMSSNNQALLAVMSAVGAVLDGGRWGAAGQRWVPDVPGYGLICPAKGKVEGVRNAGFPFVAVVDKRPVGLPEILGAAGYVERAHACFMEGWQEFQVEVGVVPALASDSGVPEVAERLRTMVAETVGEGRRMRDSAAAVILMREEVTAVFGDVAQSVGWDVDACRSAVLMAAADAALAAGREPEIGSGDRSAAWEVATRWWAAEKVWAAVVQSFVDDVASGRYGPTGGRMAAAVQVLEAQVSRRIGGGGLGAMLTEFPDAIAAVVDVVVAHRAWQLAARYWEGRWIVAALGDPRGAGDERWRWWSKLTPLAVSTFHVAPAAFSHPDDRNAPLWRVADMLIVDEAGQAAVDVGGVALGLGKVIVAIGDEKQIQPIPGVTAAVDAGNLVAAGLEEWEEPIGAVGLSPSTGSIMKAARSAATAEVFLDQHYRCRPEIVAFVNDIAYGGRLVAVREGEPAPALLPALGFAHVVGDCDQVGSSWVNRVEADAIVRWLMGRQHEIEEHYGRPIADCVGVIAPYKAQAEHLMMCLRKAATGSAGSAGRDGGASGGAAKKGWGKEKGLGGITCGSVHSFQGSERRIIVLSATGVRGGRAAMLERDEPFLLNVAASRAQDSFIVVGDMGIFGSSRGGPAAVLGRHLFADEGNAVAGFMGAMVSGGPGDAESGDGVGCVLRHLLGTVEHGRRLQEVLECEATERVLIVSPFLSIRAVENDQLGPSVQAAVRRGVRVVVAFDECFTKGKMEAEKARVALVAAGAEVWCLAGVHAKSLAWDDCGIIEGSFNWLSAVRDTSHRWARHEASIECRGPGVDAMVVAAWKGVERLERRAVPA